jgi:hypothetical protein
MSRLHCRAGVAVAVAGLVLVSLPAATEANEFTINACQADRAEFSTRAFEDFANRGMMWKRACNPIGPGLRGLVTANVVRAGKVQRGSRAYFVLSAPAGTHFTRLSWSGEARRDDCRYALQLWASRPDGSAVAIKNVRANRRCPDHGHGQAAGWPAAHVYDIPYTTKIYQRVLCVASSKRPYCSAHSVNYIRTFKARATVVDTSPPGVAILRDNPFTRGAWVHGTQQVNYTALDNVGVRSARPVFGSAAYGDTLRPCNYALPVPCANGPGSIRLGTYDLSEGTQALRVQAQDAAANWGTSSPITVRIDHTAPGAVAVGIDGGETWRNRNGFDLIWANPQEPDRAPITAAHYRLCHAGASTCATDQRTSIGIDRVDDLLVPGPGEWQFRLWREDAAGNQEPTNASVPVTLRYDPDPPQLGFEDSPASDPTRISVLVTDQLSGLGSGQIEVSRQGSGSWQVLATQQAGNHLVTRIDDARLPAGRYELRATARDRATNENSTDRRLDGSPMVLNLPLRVPTIVRAGVLTTRGARGHRRHLAPKARLHLGRQVKVEGQLRTRSGRAIAGAQVQVLERSTASPEHVLATLTTDERGRWVYLARATSTSVLRVLHPGTATTLPSQREVSLLVPAASTIRARPRRLLNGQAVAFGGAVRSRPIPTSGKFVELQVVLSGRWQTFKTVRSDLRGKWTVRYRFRRSCGLTAYKFRARLPAEAGYPFEPGRTRAVVVRVRGRPCR